MRWRDLWLAPGAEVPRIDPARIDRARFSAPATSVIRKPILRLVRFAKSFYRPLYIKEEKRCDPTEFFHLIRWLEAKSVLAKRLVVTYIYANADDHARAESPHPLTLR
jgi:hypothetical protein